MFKLKTLVLDIANFANNLVTFAKIQQIGAYKTLANITGSTANLSEVNIGYTPNGAVTLSGNVTYTKADFAGRTHLLLSTNSGTVRTFTVSNTGFVAGDFICLLIDQNSSGNVSVAIDTSSFSNNRGNIIQAVYNGTSWTIWTGGGVGSALLGNTRTSFGFGAEVIGISSTGYGFSVNTTDDDASAYGRNSIAGNIASAYGRSSNASQYGFSGGAYASSNNFVRHNSIGTYARGRRYGATRIHLGNTTSTSDATNPSLNGEKIAWQGTTTNATITEIFLRGVSSNRCVLQANNVLSFRGQCVAYRSNYTGSARWSIEGLIKRNNGNNTTFVGVTATLTHSDGTGNTLVLTIDADDTNEALRVQVTGNASETWTWGVELELLDLRIA
jgi:hypothetical protein